MVIMGWQRWGLWQCYWWFPEISKHFWKVIEPFLIKHRPIFNQFQISQEQWRPQFHFSPETGWANKIYVEIKFRISRYSSENFKKSYEQFRFRIPKYSLENIMKHYEQAGSMIPMGLSTGVGSTISSIRLSLFSSPRCPNDNHKDQNGHPNPHHGDNISTTLTALCGSQCHDHHNHHNDHNDLPPHSHHDKIPPWWEYVSN